MFERFKQDKLGELMVKLKSIGWKAVRRSKIFLVLEKDYGSGATAQIHIATGVTMPPRDVLIYISDARSHSLGYPRESLEVDTRASVDKNVRRILSAIRIYEDPITLGMRSMFGGD